MPPLFGFLLFAKLQVPYVVPPNSISTLSFGTLSADGRKCSNSSGTARIHCHPFWMSGDRVEHQIKEMEDRKKK